MRLIARMLNVSGGTLIREETCPIVSGNLIIDLLMTTLPMSNGYPNHQSDRHNKLPKTFDTHFLVLSRTRLRQIL